MNDATIEYERSIDKSINALNKRALCYKKIQDEEEESKTLTHKILFITKKLVPSFRKPHAFYRQTIEYQI